MHTDTAMLFASVLLSVLLYGFSLLGLCGVVYAVGVVLHLIRPL